MSNANSQPVKPQRPQCRGQEGEHLVSWTVLLGLFLNIRTCVYLRSRGLVICHQSQTKYGSKSKYASSMVKIP